MGDRRKCQTYTASPAEPGGLPAMLARPRTASTVRLSLSAIMMMLFPAPAISRS